MLWRFAAPFCFDGAERQDHAEMRLDASVYERIRTDAMDANQNKTNQNKSQPPAASFFALMLGRRRRGTASSMEYGNKCS